MKDAFGNLGIFVLNEVLFESSRCSKWSTRLRYGGHPQVDTYRPRVQSGMVPQGQLTTINQSQLNTQLGLNNNNGTHGSPSPPESKSATPSPSSSVHEDDADDAAKVRERERERESVLPIL